jgi:hypothetical protein
MSDPFAHNSNYPGASAGRGRRPPTTSKPNPNNGQPDWFNSMEQTPPPNAISAVAPQTTASSNNNGRRIGEGKPRPPSKAKPPKQSTGPGSTAFGSRLTIGGRNNNNNSQSYPTTNSTNAFPSAAASASMPASMPAQTQYTNNTRNRDNNAYGAASYTAPSQPKQSKPAQQPPQQRQPPPRQQQQQPPQQQFNQQHSYQQPPSSSQSYSSGPGMFNPSMPPAVLSGKMGEPVNHNAALAAAALPTQQQQQQQQHSLTLPAPTPCHSQYPSSSVKGKIVQVSDSITYRMGRSTSRLSSGLSTRFAHANPIKNSRRSGFTSSSICVRSIVDPSNLRPMCSGRGSCSFEGEAPAPACSFEDAAGRGIYGEMIRRDRSV